jgi:hypothetical protein
VRRPRALTALNESVAAHLREAEHQSH